MGASAIVVAAFADRFRAKWGLVAFIRRTRGAWLGGGGALECRQMRSHRRFRVDSAIQTRMFGSANSRDGGAQQDPGLNPGKVRHALG